MTAGPKPTDINLHHQSRVLEISFNDGSKYELPCEYLRVYSPSAEVRGHGPGHDFRHYRDATATTCETCSVSLTLTAFFAWALRARPAPCGDGREAGV